MQIPDRNYRAPELEAVPYHSFKELIDDVLAHGNESVTLPSNLVLMYQAATAEGSLGELGLLDGAHPFANMTMNLTLDRLHVTSVDNFWKPALSALNSGQVAHRQGFDDEFRLNAGLHNAVLLLPRLVPRLHETGIERTPDQDPRAWDVAHVIKQVEALVNLTGLTTLPSLEEWAVLADKRQLHQMYKGYFEADPSHRTPPIPTVFLDTPGTPEELVALCYSSDLISSNAHLETAMEVIYDGLLRLEAELHMLRTHGRDISRISGAKMLEDGEHLFQYVIKREFAEGAIMMTSFDFPAKALQFDNLTGMPRMYRGDEPWRAKPPLPAGLSQELRQSGALTTEFYLREAAQLMALKSCGEGWLLQPKIMDMPNLEYRVYLIGGAAAKGTPEDTVVVYTPAVLDNGIYMANLTIPPGYFWSDVIEPPGGSSDDLQASANEQDVDIASKLGQSREPWHCPELYQKLVDAALSGAHAMAAYGNGSLTTVAQMFVRVDVVLGTYWDDEGANMFVEPLINEMDWFNSASQMIPHWSIGGPDISHLEGDKISWGQRLAIPLLREIAHRFDDTRDSTCKSDL
ncbi:g11592 [Coccomyxa elongata]